MKIKELKLLTSKLSDQTDFYANVLGLELLERSDTSVRFSLGASTLIFEQSQDFHPYHFAINIPAYKEQEALQWLQSRVGILVFEGKAIQDFSAWNARALYFYDRDRNIVEFIARRNLKNESSKAFDASCLLELSEIGVAVSDISTAYSAIQKICPLPIFDGSFEKFCALGEDSGLFICINKDRKTWFPTGDKAFSADFEIKIEASDGFFGIRFKEGILEEYKL